MAHIEVTPLDSAEQAMKEALEHRDSIRSYRNSLMSRREELTREINRCDTLLHRFDHLEGADGEDD